MTDTAVEVQTPERGQEENPPPAGRGPAVAAPSGLARVGAAVAPRSLIILLVLFVVIFSVLRPDQFATWTNVRTILFTQSIGAIVALGAFLPLLAGEIDISFGGVISISGVTAAQLLGHGWPMAAAIVLALLLGAVVGAINSFIVVRKNVPSFIATLAMATVLSGGALLISGGQSLYKGITGGLYTAVAYRVVGIPLLVFYCLVLAAVLSYVTWWTPFGRRLRATGAGREAADLIGVRTGRYVTVSFVLCSTIAALAGVLQAAYLQSASPTGGASFTLSAVAAVFLGAVVSRRGHLNVWGTLLAVLTLGVGLTGLTMLGAPEWVPDVFNGLALIAALLISGAGRRRGRALVAN